MPPASPRLCCYRNPNHQPHPPRRSTSANGYRWPVTVRPLWREMEMPADLTRPYGHAAAMYRAAGWVCVLPLPYGRKVFPPEGYTGRHGADPTPARVGAWVKARPGSNVALRLPTTVVGLDLEDRKSTRLNSS